MNPENEQPLLGAAARNQLAAEEAAKAFRFGYARSLFLDAAILFERQGNAAQFAHCYYQSKLAETHLFLNLFLLGREDIESTAMREIGFVKRLAAFFRWISSMHNRILWGYGERPLRTLGVAFGLILLCGIAYDNLNSIAVWGQIRNIDFGEALYFSVMTFSTVGYGDYVPAGSVSRALAILEALSGMMLMPLFLIGLSRRYLRMHR